jgi:RimJ/RimL family protein N-acetyltransferase
VKLETDRLVLRQWEERDRDPFAALNADPDVFRYLRPGGTPLTHEQSDDQFDRFVRHWDEHGFGLFSAEDRELGRSIGFVGLAVPTFLPEVLPAVEIGWRLERSAWGRGLATEGATAVLAWGFGPLGLDRVVSIRHRDNDASRRVMEKLGLVPWRETVHPEHGIPLVVHEGRRAVLLRDLSEQAQPRRPTSSAS